MKNQFWVLMVMLFFAACQNPTQEQSQEQIQVQEQEQIQANDTEEATKKIDAPFCHAVYFWMKEGLNSEEAKYFESQVAMLADSSAFVKYVHLGKPAMSDREVVDNSYGYSLVAFFESKEDEASYQVEPIHLEFIDNCKDLWTKVIVYDSIEY